jgi:hypothetical protein
LRQTKPLQGSAAVEAALPVEDLAVVEDSPEADLPVVEDSPAARSEVALPVPGSGPPEL